MNVADTEDGWRRVIVEKPFGTSLETAQELNKHLCRIFEEEEILPYRPLFGKRDSCRISWYSVSPTVFSNPFGTGIMWIQSR